MDDLGKANIMPLELAIQRELAYRSKVAMLLSPSDYSFVGELRSLEVQSSSTGPSETPSSGPSSTLGSSSRLSGFKRQLPYSLPHKLSNRATNFFCNLCRVPCSCYTSYKQHLKGKKHQSNLLDLKSGKKDDDKQKQQPGEGNQRLRCELCKIWCMNEDDLEAHLAGQKHKNTLANPGLAKNSGKEIATGKKCEVCGIHCSNDHMLKEHFNGKKHKSGLRNLEKASSQIAKKQYWCQPCNIWFVDKDSLNKHFQGRRHNLQLHGW